MDINIDEKFKLDDLYDLPVVLPEIYIEEMNAVFERIYNTNDLCVKYSEAYKIISILLRCGKQKAPADMVLYSIRLYIQNNYMHTITIAQLAAVAHSSLSKFYHLFKESFGCTPIEYINMTRISYSAILLETTDMSVSDIAVAVGFADQFYYSKTFSKFYGLSPSQHRKLKRSKLS
ncbi:MAG TPA: AraC family transcriptional regulator [Bacillota bacterium]|nr:AraC family transcriptional regulator [Bacillota bacterium]